jgi:acyl-CoA dehydrogenase
MIRDPEQFEQLLAPTVRTLHPRRVHPARGAIDREDEIPEPLVQRMRELGLFGHSIPEAYGGAGLTTEELALREHRGVAGATAFRARFGGNTGIASEALIVDGTPSRSARWLPRLASGELTGCFALTEPEAGSDATALRTTAVRDGDDYLSSAAASATSPTRRSPTCSPCSRAPTTARQGRRGITAFLVERGTPGLSTPPAYRKMGQHGSPVGEVHLDELPRAGQRHRGRRANRAGLSHRDARAEQAAHQPGRPVRGPGHPAGRRDGRARAGSAGSSASRSPSSSWCSR